MIDSNLVLTQILCINALGRRDRQGRQIYDCITDWASFLPGSSQNEEPVSRAETPSRDWKVCRSWSQYQQEGHHTSVKQTDLYKSFRHEVSWKVWKVGTPEASKQMKLRWQGNCLTHRQLLFTIILMLVTWPSPKVQQFRNSRLLRWKNWRSAHCCAGRPNIVAAKGIGHVNLKERMIWNHYDM